ncbi:MAG: trigger factor [Candidatus Omnitrophica bacterium]|nr:trigger factor [Candidatus Omnitrophota bacterium]
MDKKIKTRIKNTSSYGRLLEIEVHQETVDETFTSVYAEIQKAATIPGFRRGKAPLDIIKKQHGENAHSEVIDRLVGPSYYQAVDELKLLPMGLPEISEVEVKEGNPLKFKARFDLRPKIVLKKYKSIKLKRRKEQVTDEKISEVLATLRDTHATFNVIEDRGVRTGDLACCDIICCVDDKEVRNIKDSWVLVDKDKYLPEIVSSLIDKKKEEEFSAEATLPNDYPDKILAGKKTRFKLRLKEIKEKVLSPLDDAFAATVGKFKTLGELKDAIRREIETRNEQTARLDVENQLIDALIKNTPFDAPPSLVENHLRRLMEKAKQDLKARGIDEKEIEKRDGELKENLKTTAERQVKAYLLLDEAAKAEGLTVEKAEVDKYIEAVAKSSRKTREEVEKYYEDKELIPQVEHQLLEAKTIELLLGAAEISE